jgi:hypothetical protein
VRRGRRKEVFVTFGVDVPVHQFGRDIGAALGDRIISGQHLDGSYGEALTDGNGRYCRAGPLRGPGDQTG